MENSSFLLPHLLVVASKLSPAISFKLFEAQALIDVHLALASFLPTLLSRLPAAADHKGTPAIAPILTPSASAETPIL